MLFIVSFLSRVFFSSRAGVGAPSQAGGDIREGAAGSLFRGRRGAGEEGGQEGQRPIKARISRGTPDDNPATYEVYVLLVEDAGAAVFACTTAVLRQCRGFESLPRLSPLHSRHVLPCRPVVVAFRRFARWNDVRCAFHDACCGVFVVSGGQQLPVALFHSSLSRCISST